jgi:hypothetical protein
MTHASPQTGPSVEANPEMTAPETADLLTIAALAARLQAEQLTLHDAELPRVFVVAQYLRQAAALIRAAERTTL